MQTYSKSSFLSFFQGVYLRSLEQTIVYSSSPEDEATMLSLNYSEKEQDYPHLLQFIKLEKDRYLVQELEEGTHNIKDEYKTESLEDLQQIIHLAVPNSMELTWGPYCVMQTNFN